MPFASHVEIVNLSPWGVALKADRRLDAGGKYSLRVEQGDDTLDASGVVMWSVLSGFGEVRGERVPLYSAGLRLSDVLGDRLLRAFPRLVEAPTVSDERRLSGIRFRIDAPAVLDGFETYRVKLISLTGMLIEAGCRLDLHDVYPMEILPSPGDPIRPSGRVAYKIEVEEDAKAHFEIGIEFVGIGPQDRSRLETLLATLPRDRSAAPTQGP